MGHPKPLDVVALLQPISPEALQLIEEGKNVGKMGSENIFLTISTSIDSL